MNNVTFIRIPKNASTSVYTFFGKHNSIRNEYLSADNRKYMNIFEPSHCTIAEAEQLLGAGIPKLPVIAITRNPYDRLISMFFFARKYDLGKLYGISTNSFGRFVEQFFAWSYDPDFFHGVSQSSFIRHKDVTSFYICRFENLKNDLANFINSNNLDFDINDLGDLNKTNHKNYREYYSANSKSIVNTMWGEDLDLFSYCF